MLPSSSIDLLFLILAILATRSMTLHQNQSGHQQQQSRSNDNNQRSTSTARVNGAFVDAGLPETPLTATFSFEQTEGQGPGGRFLSTTSSPTAAPHALPVPQITLTGDKEQVYHHNNGYQEGYVGAIVHDQDILHPIPRTTLAFRPTLRGSNSKHGRKSVSFSLSSMDEIVKSPGYKPIARRPPTPFVRRDRNSIMGPASPSERVHGHEGVGIGELVLGMSVGIGLGAGMGVDGGAAGEKDLGAGVASPLPSPWYPNNIVDNDDQEDRENGEDGMAGWSFGGAGDETPKPRVVVIGPAVGGLDHNKELVDPMGVKKQWLMPG